MDKSWHKFETRVRGMASFIWDAPCKPDHVGGVDIDGAIKLDEEQYVLIEITESDRLSKTREDIVKLITAKLALSVNNNVFCRCYCVIDGIVTRSMIEAGKSQNIKVLSFENFSQIFFDFDKYKNARASAAFGSAINPKTGKADNSAYVPVMYSNITGSKLLAVGDIAKLLLDGKHVVLTGEYGSGKSRCIRELFTFLSCEYLDSNIYPISIDLRESWGLKRGAELIRRHFSDLALDTKLQNSAIRALNSGTLCLLFDGFDEIGSQAWSNDTEKLKSIRLKSLEGVRDLIKKGNAGVFISGREHYFNSNEEMLNALGVDVNKTVLLRCRDEFTEQEMNKFFERISSDITLPEWLPRRPLICQTISDLDADEIDQMFGIGQDEVSFWHHFINIISIRDSWIRESFDALTIQRILVSLARATRTSASNVGPITLSDIQKAFESVVGEAPVEDASQMLQRLPALGRVRSESNDRQFIDIYILDGLRAIDVADQLTVEDSKKTFFANMAFRNPLDNLGQKILLQEMEGREKEAKRLAKLCASYNNRVAASDIIASLVRGLSLIDFEGTSIEDGYFLRFDMSAGRLKNLSISKSVFGTLLLPSSPPLNTTIEACLCERVVGVSGTGGLPAWIKGLSVDKFDSTESTSRIRKIGLDPKHEVLVAIVRKTFFQKGSGRKEEALTRGLGEIAAIGVVDKIINLLIREDIIEKFKGNEGWVYAPKRSQAGRMKTMLYELQTSSDEIWMTVKEM